MISENDILKVSANFLSAITDVWNIAFLIMWGGITLFALNTLVKYSLTLPLLFIFLVSLIFLVLQIWGMFTVFIVVDETELHYHAAYRDIVLKWHEIDSVKFESFKKQITLRASDKTLYLRRFGISSEEYQAVEAFMLEKIVENEIEVVDGKLTAANINLIFFFFANIFLILITKNTQAEKYGYEPYTIGHALGSFIFFALLPFALISIPSGIYWLIKRKLMPGFFIILWLIWILWMVIVLSGLYYY